MGQSRQVRAVACQDAVRLSAGGSCLCIWLAPCASPELAFCILIMLSLLLPLARAVVLRTGFPSALCFGLWLKVVVFSHKPSWESEGMVWEDQVAGWGQRALPGYRNHTCGLMVNMSKNSLKKDQTHLWTATDHHGRSLEFCKIVFKIDVCEVVFE